MQLSINGKDVGLKVSMWVLDEDRLNKMYAEKPESIIWKFTSTLFIAYKNFCRYSKMQPEISIEDFELYVDDQLSSEEGRGFITGIFDDLSAQINAMAGTSEKKMPVSTLAGKEQESLPMAQSG